MPLAHTPPTVDSDEEPLPLSEDGKAARSLIESAYLRLRRDIIEGRHPAGEKLRVEHLKDMYQTSAGTLREALALLVSDSLVVSQAQRGFRVAPMSLEDLADITRTRTLLECEALRESIRQGDDEWEARIVSTYHRLSLAEARLTSQVAGTFDEWEERNQAFHEALVSACSSRWILRLRALLYQQSRRYRRISAVRPVVLQVVHEQHRAIYEAALSRDIERADQVLSEHLQLAASAIREKDLSK
ncbi:HTH-type transcriptional repressor GlaR [Paraburkholderia caffeinitolerans]|uniref:HTH-type transcriptional repressor GlaR n=1 Tax=Paraburkholderia caffeinitolerans TaxID=1723730 RepID=A0A6J5FWF5_9BURK|nr:MULTISPECIES: FCD domain-containing protein [Paraburkholderia]CAB3788720.1 HTH-type transcriptional repressor GlaR [Paraburkholderia caffeinitolerans]